jgi:hypothetical protein
MHKKAIYIELLGLHVRDGAYRAVFDALGRAIEAAERRLGDAKKAGDEDYYDFLVDEECEAVENILGAAFVVAQARITAIVSEAIGLSKELDPASLGKLPFANPGVTKASLVSFGAPVVGAVAAVAAIDAVANYFKHREEWPAGWAVPPKSQAASTIATITQLGLAAGSTGNLRTAASALGWPNDRPGDLGWVEDAIEAWGSAVLSEFEKVA